MVSQPTAWVELAPRERRADRLAPCMFSSLMNLMKLGSAGRMNENSTNRRHRSCGAEMAQFHAFALLRRGFWHRSVRARAVKEIPALFFEVMVAKAPCYFAIGQYCCKMAREFRVPSARWPQIRFLASQECACRVLSRCVPAVAGGFFNNPHRAPRTVGFASVRPALAQQSATQATMVGRHRLRADA